jgi:tRNA-specific 2-thiouridylase
MVGQENVRQNSAAHAKWQPADRFGLETMESLDLVKENSLGLEGPPAETLVVVAMSGGVDSSVTAGLLAEQGYDVVGITLQLYDYGEAVAKPGTCCAGQDIYDAKSVAQKLDIPHYVLDYESRFRAEVMEDFAESYLRGETPIPCVRCNQGVKFRDLLETAQDLGAAALATGHYVQRIMGASGPELHRGTDDKRDQSYFLFATTRTQLDFLRFPLGNLPKRETRRIAERLGLKVAQKPDSQDICFVPNGSYADVVARLRPGALDPGEIVDLEGRVLGNHQGIVNYTLGQRRGLNIGGLAEPLFVVRLEPEAKRVVVGPKEALARNVVHLKEFNWLGDEGAGTGGQAVACTVKLRSTTAAAPAHLVRLADGLARVELETPQDGISPGQAAVCYDSARVLGGGWITGADLAGR